MDKIQVYHHTRCTKSNQAIAFLTEKGIVDENLEVIRYFDQPISEAIALTIIDQLGDDWTQIIRKEDAKKLGIEIPKDFTKQWAAKHIVEEPKLMQRPIIIQNGRAFIARPTEKILELIDFQ